MREALQLQAGHNDHCTMSDLFWCEQSSYHNKLSWHADAAPEGCHKNIWNDTVLFEFQQSDIKHPYRSPNETGLVPHAYRAFTGRHGSQDMLGSSAANRLFNQATLKACKVF